MDQCLIFNLKDTKMELRKIMLHSTYKDYYLCSLPAGRALYTLSFPKNLFSALNLESGEWSVPYLLWLAKDYLFNITWIYVGRLIMLGVKVLVGIGREINLWVSIYKRGF